eukprot:TRINITY_DN3181_c0_g1_i2.p1 TRINITY_DN3181_c0_g1~~TRINITY_DN3181_c0_g1_i2.p1  ORF type:complete len:997 (-),score=332.14 TRINITY_DN3181_c0_g1_i2:85-3075(-)
MSSKKRRAQDSDESEDLEDIIAIKKQKSQKKAVASDGEEDSTSTNGKLEETQHSANGGENAYRVGSILRVRVKDFVTYDDCELFPGANLNVVIGPNGTGKSSIVCALCLGLGGATKILGRAKEVGEFVKNGMENGFTEIDLCGKNGKTVTIKRKISKDNSTEWWINGKSATKKAIKDLVKDLNIQIDNLCQFLPQDRVSSFAQLSKFQLLEETEKAVGSESMLERHKKLIELKQRVKELETTSHQHTELLESLKTAQKSIERDVIRFQERQKWLKKVEDLEKKKPWMEFEQQRLICLEVKKIADDSQKELKTYEQEKRAPLQKKLKEAEEKESEVGRQAVRALSSLKEMDKERRGLMDQIEGFENEEDRARLELNALHTRAADRKKEANMRRKDMEKLEAELSEIPEPTGNEATNMEEINKQLKVLNAENRTVQSSLIEANGSLGDERQRALRIQNELKQLEDFRKQKLDFLRRNFEETHRAFQWIENAQREGKLRERVFGPVFIEMNVREVLHQHYLQQALPQWITMAFITQDRNDNELITRELRDKMGLNINVTNIPREPYQFNRPHPIDQIRKYGFEAYFDQIFEAPEPVKDALRRMAYIHNIAAGGKESVKHVQETLKETELGMFFTPQSVYTKTKSKYGNRDTSTRVDQLRTRQNGLFGGVDMSRKDALTHELREREANMQDLDSQVKQQKQREMEIQREVRALEARKKDIEATKSKKVIIENKIRRLMGEIKELEAGEDTAAEQAKIEKKLKMALDKRVKAIRNMRKQLKEFVTKSLEYDLFQLRKTQASMHLQNLKNQNSQYDREYDELKRKAGEAQERLNHEKTEAANLKKAAEKKAPLTDELKALFETLPGTLEDVEKEIDEAHARADTNYSTNPAVIEQYEKRKKEIEDLEDKLNGEGNSLEKQKETIERIKSEWLPPLEELVGKINVSFSKYMLAIGCAGEVLLEQDPDQNFEKYAILIKVKFRAVDDLVPLDSHERYQLRILQS